MTELTLIAKITELEKRCEQLTRDLQEIADADGREGYVHGSLYFIHGFEAGTKAQGERAKKALGQAYKEPMPSNILLWKIKQLEAEIERLKAAALERAHETYVHDSEKPRFNEQFASWED